MGESLQLNADAQPNLLTLVPMSTVFFEASHNSRLGSLPIYNEAKS